MQNIGTRLRREFIRLGCLEHQNLMVGLEMSRIGAKDVLTGKIPEVNYLIIHDKGLADDFAVAINILTSQGWNIKHIWAAGSFHFALFKRK